MKRDSDSDDGKFMVFGGSLDKPSHLGVKFLLLLHINFHFLLEYFVGFLQTLLEDLHEGVQVFSGVLRHQVHSQPGLSDLHHWELDPVHVHSRIHHYSRN